MSQDMRAGDIIKSRRGNIWIVAAVINGTPIDLPAGRHLLLIRDHDSENGTELLMTLRSEGDLHRGHKRNYFDPGFTSARYGADSSITLFARTRSTARWLRQSPPTRSSSSSKTARCWSKRRASLLSCS